jgi:hypothetical protein
MAFNAALFIKDLSINNVGSISGIERKKYQETCVCYPDPMLHSYFFMSLSISFLKASMS